MGQVNSEQWYNINIYHGEEFKWQSIMKKHLKSK